MAVTSNEHLTVIVHRSQLGGPRGSILVTLACPDHGAESLDVDADHIYCIDCGRRLAQPISVI